jgi:SAM-dependent methyltransferase
MNRTQWRDARQPNLPGTPSSSAGGQASIADLFARAARHHDRGELKPAIEAYKIILKLMPRHAAASERLAQIYLAQGRRDKASLQYAELARQVPQSLGSFARIVDTLKILIPDMAPVFAGAAATSLDYLLKKPGVQHGTSIGGNVYFRCVLESTVVRVAALEQWLTGIRAAILQTALADKPPVDSDLLAFSAALAQQCFINEYIFALAPEELTSVDHLNELVNDALSAAAPVEPLQLAALAMYRPLHTLPGASVLAERSWPEPLAAVVTQQVLEPAEEQRLRATMPRLTAIGDGVTAQVRQQYEENPYPRWVRLNAPPASLRILDDYLRQQFPTARFRPVGRRDSLDILEAGCGTGRHALEVAQAYQGARVLAVDISLASLASAKRKVPAALADKIEFAQADIMAIGSIDRRFGLINSGGVLHHMGDPLGGWRELIKLLKPNGLMQIGLYSALARRDIVAARRLIAERGYQSTPEGIRRCRQDLFNGAEPFKFMTMSDFFSMSDCRDLLFHVQEKRFTIPEIKDFIVANDLNFIGFNFNPMAAHLHHQSVFARNGWPMTDLDRWDAYERDNPDIFANMYVLWLQKN